jgi:hypothetical protein
LPANDPEGSAVVLARLLRAGCVPRPSVADGLLRALDAYRWAEFWSAEGRLEQLLGLASTGEGTGAVWGGFTGQLDHQVVLGSAGQKKLLGLLAGVVEKMGRAAPRESAQAVEDWQLLLRHFETGGNANAGPADLTEACQRRGLKPGALLRAYFRQFVVPLPATDKVLDPFVGAFQGFYLPGESYPDHSTRLQNWLGLLKEAPDSSRGTYQLYYLEHFVPFAFRARLADELAKYLQPQVVRKLKSAPPPEAVPVRDPVVVAAPAAIAVPAAEPKARGPHRGAGHDFRAQARKLGLIAFLLACGLVVGLVIGVLLASKPAESTTPPDAGGKKKSRKTTEKPATRADGKRDAEPPTRAGPATPWPDPRPVLGQLLVLSRPVGQLGTPLAEGAGRFGQVVTALSQQAARAKPATAREPAEGNDRLRDAVILLLKDDLCRVCNLDPKNSWDTQRRQLQRIMDRLAKAAHQAKHRGKVAEISDRLAAFARDVRSYDWKSPEARRRLGALLADLEEFLLDVEVLPRDLDELVKRLRSS